MWPLSPAIFLILDDSTRTSNFETSSAELLDPQLLGSKLAGLRDLIVIMSTPTCSDLRSSFEWYRAQILQSNRDILKSLLDQNPIALDSTSPTRKTACKRIVACWSPVRAPNDIFPLPLDGTSPLLPQEIRDLFQRIEEVINAQSASGFRPLRLPQGFKELCALMDSLKGPGPSATNCQCIIHLSGAGWSPPVSYGQRPPFAALTVDSFETFSGPDTGFGWDAAARMQVGSEEVLGG